MASKSPAKKASRSLSKGGLTPTEGMELLNEMDKRKSTTNNISRNVKSKTAKRKGSRKQSSGGEGFVMPLQLDLPPEPMSKEEIERMEKLKIEKEELKKKRIEEENRALQQAEEKLEELKVKAEEKEIIFNKVLLEIKRMLYIFSKAKNIDIHTVGKEFNEEPKVRH